MAAGGLTSSVGAFDIRPLEVADADVIAALHVQIWRDTYAGIMSDEALAGLDVEDTAARWRTWLGDTDAPPSLGAFVRETSELAGWITVGPARDEEAPVARELWVLNVAAAHHGSGIAQALMKVGLGDDPAYLWVVEGNDRAIAFYRKHGFELDGQVRVEEEGNRDLRMVRTGG